MFSGKDSRRERTGFPFLPTESRVVRLAFGLHFLRENSSGGLVGASAN